ncbi:hypothetical protein BLA18628_02822 [Burkholderia aenigmatica]|nr:hypothetical protein BLA18628_02822 [Burkholderia aenigmatica]
MRIPTDPKSPASFSHAFVGKPLCRSRPQSSLVEPITKTHLDLDSVKLHRTSTRHDIIYEIRKRWRDRNDIIHISFRLPQHIFHLPRPHINPKVIIPSISSEWKVCPAKPISPLGILRPQPANLLCGTEVNFTLIEIFFTNIVKTLHLHRVEVARSQIKEDIPIEIRLTVKISTIISYIELHKIIFPVKTSTKQHLLHYCCRHRRALITKIKTITAE